MMNKENTQYLHDKYPKIFPEIVRELWDSLTVKSTQPPRRFRLYFECGDGWLQIIDHLCQGIQEIVDREKCSQVVAVQVKEKFGGLRFYIDGGNKEVYTLIHKTEDESYTICEACGSPEGKERRGGWIKVLCDDCVIDRK
jgi:hypothetical protein